MSPPPIFRAAIAELGRLLIYELGRDWLPTMQQQVMSPVGLADATFVDPMQPVKVITTHALNTLALPQVRLPTSVQGNAACLFLCCALASCNALR